MKYALTIVALLFALGVSPQLTTLVHERREDQTKLNPAKSKSQVEPLRLVKTVEVPGVEGKFDHFARISKASDYSLPLQFTRLSRFLIWPPGNGFIGGFVTPHAI